MEEKQISCGSVLPPLSTNYPWFVAQNLDAEDDNEVHVFYTVHGPQPSHYRCRIPHLLGKRIRGCFHGWVLLSSHPHDVKWSLWNPFTSKVIRLPSLILKDGNSDDIKYCCLSSPPDDPNSVLLLTRTRKPDIVFCRLDRKKWTEMSYANQMRSITGDFNGLLHFLTCCNGKVYGLFKVYAVVSGSERLVQVDIVVKKKEVVISLLPILKLPCPFNVCPVLIPFLKGSSTELFTIIICLKDEMRKIVGAVYLFKLDMTSMTWEEINDLKDTIFSVTLDSDLSGFYSPAIASELGGYIHILGEKGKIIYSYDVKDKTISLSSMSSLVGTSHVSAWAMLECNRLEGDHSDPKQEEEEEEEKDINNEIVVRLVKHDEVVFKKKTADESYLPNTLFRVLEMIMVFYVVKFLPVSCFGKDSRLEGDYADVKKDEFNSTRDESHLLNIPFELLERVMEFCVGVEYMKFRATCKRCHAAAPLIEWSNQTASKRLQICSLDSPWLILFDKHQGIMTFTDPMFGDNYFIKTPQALICDFELYSSKYGWLLMYIGEGPLVFFNPFTRDILELPPVIFLESFCFSEPPTSPDCMVVGFTTRSEWHVWVHFVAREQTWRRISLDFGGNDPYTFHFPTFYGRDLYALCNNGELEVFKAIDGEDYFWLAVIDAAPTSCCGQNFLVKCDQHFFLVIVGEHGKSIDVFKSNDGKEKWEKIDCLGRHMIYISDSTCLCIEAKTPKIGNKIYFPRFHSGKIVFYSLETCRFHTFNVEENFMDFFGMKHHLPSHTWIEPSWS